MYVQAYAVIVTGLTSGALAAWLTGRSALGGLQQALRGLAWYSLAFWVTSLVGVFPELIWTCRALLASPPLISPGEALLGLPFEMIMFAAICTLVGCFVAFFVHQL